MTYGNMPNAGESAVQPEAAWDDNAGILSQVGKKLVVSSISLLGIISKTDYPFLMLFHFFPML